MKPRGMNGNGGATLGRALRRGPILTAIPPLRTLFEILDARRLPYSLIGPNEQICKWRQGKHGIYAWALIEFADKLDCDIVVVPRQRGDTRATLPRDDDTHSAGGTGHGATAS